MTPNLPSNPFTISDNRNDVLDVSWLNGRHLHNHEVLRLIENQLELLRRYDNYDRGTNPDREAAKAVLNARKQKLSAPPR